MTLRIAYRLLLWMIHLNAHPGCVPTAASSDPYQENVWSAKGRFVTTQSTTTLFSKVNSRRKNGFQAISDTNLAVLTCG